MKRLALFIILLSSLFTLRSFAQDTENTGALWTEVSVTKALPHNLSIEAGLGHRTQDWFDESNRWDVGVGLNWKFNKHWKFGVGYIFLMKHYPQETSYKTSEELEYKYATTGASPQEMDAATYLGNPYTDENGTLYKYRGYNDKVKNDTRIDERFWRQKHRVYVDAAYTTKFWKTLRVTIRERYQLTMVPSKTIDRTRYRETTITRYRDPDYGTNANFDEVTKYWQTGDVIYAQDITDPDDLGAVKDVTTSYLAEHNPLNTIETYDHEKRSKTLHLLRSRLKLSIDKKGWDWEPYVSIETHNNLGEKWNLDKIRASAGVDYSITKHHQIGIGYIFNRENDDDGNYNIHAINIGYNYKF